MVVGIKSVAQKWIRDLDLVLSCDHSWKLAFILLLLLCNCKKLLHLWALSTWEGRGLKGHFLKQLSRRKLSLPGLLLYPRNDWLWVTCPLLDQSQARSNNVTLAHINPSTLGADGGILTSQRCRVVFVLFCYTTSWPKCFPGGTVVNEFTCQCRRCKRHEFDP